MHSIKFPSGINEGRKELIVMVLEDLDFTWSERVVDGSFTVVTPLDTKQLKNLSCALTRWAPGAIVGTIEDTVTVPRMVTTEPPEQTWYQYIARLRGVTGYRVNTDRHDEVLGFYETSLCFRFCLRRVGYRESIRRDTTTWTKLEMTTIKSEGGQWVRSVMSMDDELAPDHINFALKNHAMTRWVNAQPIDINKIQQQDPGMAAALEFFVRFPNLVSE